jgi:amino acid transporter
MIESPPAAGMHDCELPRGLGLWQAVSLNVANMVGIGPFITIPAFLATMGGPQALMAWVIAAILVICDGLVWSELGALPVAAALTTFSAKFSAATAGADCCRSSLSGHSSSAGRWRWPRVTSAGCNISNMPFPASLI